MLKVVLESSFFVLLAELALHTVFRSLVNSSVRHPLEDDDITVVFFPGVQLATGKKSRFLYV